MGTILDANRQSCSPVDPHQTFKLIDNGRLAIVVGSCLILRNPRKVDKEERRVCPGLRAELRRLIEELRGHDELNTASVQNPAYY